MGRDGGLKSSTGDGEKLRFRVELNKLFHLKIYFDEPINEET